MEEPVLLLSDCSLIATISGEPATSLQAHKTILQKSTLNIDLAGFSDNLPLRISWTISYCRFSEHVFLRQKTCSLMRYLTYDYYLEYIPTTTSLIHTHVFVRAWSVACTSNCKEMQTVFFL